MSIQRGELQYGPGGDGREQTGMQRRGQDVLKSE